MKLELLKLIVALLRTCTAFFNLLLHCNLQSAVGTVLLYAVLDRVQGAFTCKHCQYVLHPSSGRGRRTDHECWTGLSRVSHFDRAAAASHVIELETISLCKLWTSMR
jgi:hypothetical protein